jgi:hypothetical protein
MPVEKGHDVSMDSESHKDMLTSSYYSISTFHELKLLLNAKHCNKNPRTV